MKVRFLLLRREVSASDNFLGGSSFGIPEPDDPDPYGVKALEAEGLAIREAGTHQRPSAEVFHFNPAPSSPIYSNFARHSVDSPLRDKTNTKSWRSSSASLASVTRGTQTEDDDGKGPSHSPSVGTHSPARKTTEHVDENDNPQDDLSDDDDDPDEHAEIATATPVVARARMVAVPKRIPPSLPPRNPGRVSTPVKELGDGFDQVSLNDTPSKHNESDKLAEEPTHDLYEHSAAPSEAKNADDDDFHSMPVTPAEEHHQGVPGTFN